MRLGDALRRAVREPIVWFLVFGTLVFALDRATGDQPQLEILIDQSIRDRLSASWQASYGRTPEPEELQGLINNYVEEEMLYREAMELGLGRHDEIVRRRLAQKTRFLHEDSTLLPQISEQQLREWFEANRGSYERAARVSFRHVFVDTERQGPGLVQRLDELRQALLADPGLDDLPEGDLILRPDFFEEVTLKRVADQFGDVFAAQLDQAPIGQWSGPIESAYGVHFVRVEHQEPESTPSFDELLPLLQRDYAQVLRDDTNRAYIAGLKEKYSVILTPE